jgi:polyisoprenoid-binding protein YceI
VAVDATGKAARGTLQVGVRSMRTGIDLRDEHMRSEQWLDANRYPWIRLQIVRAAAHRDGKSWDFTARLTIKGTTKEVKSKARVTAIPDDLGKALGAGSWVRVRTKFDVKLSAFGVKIPAGVGVKVSDTWAIGVDLYGTTVLPKKGN